LRLRRKEFDKIRETGGNIMTLLLQDKDFVIPHRELATEIAFEKHDEFNWLLPKTVYPLIVKLLHCGSYRDQVMQGLLVSIGGLTESLVRHSSDSLVNFLFGLPDQLLPDASPCTTEQIFESIARIFEQNIQNDRISIPILGNVGLAAISSGFLEPTFADTLIQSIFSSLKKGSSLKSKNTKKLIAAIKVYIHVNCRFGAFASLNAFPDCQKQSLDKLVLYLRASIPNGIDS